jgi:hypothetical protein
VTGRACCNFFSSENKLTHPNLSSVIRLVTCRAQRVPQKLESFPSAGARTSLHCSSPYLQAVAVFTSFHPLHSIEAFPAAATSPVPPPEGSLERTAPGRYHNTTATPRSQPFPSSYHPSTVIPSSNRCISRRKSSSPCISL